MDAPVDEDRLSIDQKRHLLRELDGMIRLVRSRTWAVTEEEAVDHLVAARNRLERSLEDAEAAMRSKLR